MLGKLGTNLPLDLARQATAYAAASSDDLPNAFARWVRPNGLAMMVKGSSRSLLIVAGKTPTTTITVRLVSAERGRPRRKRS